MRLSLHNLEPKQSLINVRREMMTFTMLRETREGEARVALVPCLPDKLIALGYEGESPGVVGFEDHRRGGVK